jgi:imidazolonepropionase-like amidohydrolase
MQPTTVLKTSFSMLFLLAFALLTAQNNNLKAIKAGKVIDTKRGVVLQNQIILIENNEIKDMGTALKIPAEAEIIDLSKYTILPGLMDCHTHITVQSGGNYADMFRRTTMDFAVIAHINVKATLEAGFTTCRDLASKEFLDVALRNAINARKIPGPRLLVATYYIGSTGGHGDLVGFSPWLNFKTPEEMSGVADGVDAVRKKVRYLVKHGADVIKMGASAGVLSEEESVGAPQFTQEEMNAIVSEAAMWGKRTAAHAHGTEAIKMAIKAKVTSIEHGSFLDDEAIDMMLKNGTYLVADIYNDDYILSEFAKMGYPQKIIDKEKAVGLTQRQSFQKAVKAGVKIAYGTDAGVYPHGNNAKQFAYMVKWGMTPMQALQAATVNAADLLGLDKHLGVIEKGFWADIIAVEGNPLEDISILEKKVVFVMKEGEVYKSNLKQ